MTLAFDGPQTSELATRNPFRDYRFSVTFTRAGGAKSYTVPGCFAADGTAAGTSAQEGDKWRVHFVPDAAGEWRFRVSFRTGQDVARSGDPNAGRPDAFDGASGVLRIRERNPKSGGARAKGLLQYVGGQGKDWLALRKR